MAMNKQRRTSNLNNIVRYDTSGNVSLPAGLTVEGLDAGFVKSDANGLFSIDTSAYITLSSLLTGYVVGANADISATDTVLQAFGKLQGQIDNLPPDINIYNSNGTLTGDRTILTTSGFTLTINPSTSFTGTVKVTAQFKNDTTSWATIGGVAIGQASNGNVSVGTNQIAIGNSANASTGSQSIAIGAASYTTGNYQLVIGGSGAGDTGRIEEVYIGNGCNYGSNASVPNITINATGGNGTNSQGKNIIIAGGKGTGTGTPGDIIFATSTATATGTSLQSLTQRVWIKGENGNVGIGASPNSSYKLDVAGLGRFTNGLYVYSTSDAFLYFQKNTASKWRMGNADELDLNYFQLFDVVADKERIRWNTAGTAKFTSDITVVGNSNAAFTVQAAQPTFLVEAIGASNPVNIELKPKGGSHATIQNISGTDLEFYTGSTLGIAATIKSSKNVLIGSSSEGTGRLQVSNTSGDNHILVWGATAPSIRIDNAVSGSTQRLAIGLSTASSNFITTSVAGDICITTQSSNPLLFGANATEAMRISTAARVLVGKTLDGGQKFQVNGTVNFTGLPTSSSGLASGDLWNNGGVLSIV